MIHITLKLGLVFKNYQSTYAGESIHICKKKELGVIGLIHNQPDVVPTTTH